MLIAKSINRRSSSIFVVSPSRAGGSNLFFSLLHTSKPGKKHKWRYFDSSTAHRNALAYHLSSVDSSSLVAADMILIHLFSPFFGLNDSRHALHPWKLSSTPRETTTLCQSRPSLITCPNRVQNIVTPVGN